MARYRENLPQLSGDLFLTDGGIETTLVFHDGFDLPYFAAFDLMKRAEGRAALKRYFRSYMAVAEELGLGLILESATWRASRDWAEKLGYSTRALAEVNRQSVASLARLRSEAWAEDAPMVVSGCVGPRGDGYDPGQLMTAEAAEAYHAEQVQAFAESEADMVTAITMTNIPEAAGLVWACQAAAMPAVISFTVETDGRLPTGESLKQAIESVDRATGGGPLYYMINCAHPTHFAHVLDSGEPWLRRLCGLRANASCKSHQELDESEVLDEGDPRDLALRFAQLRRRLPHLIVLGGCCGTDHRHIAAIGAACRPGPKAMQEVLAEA